MQSGIWDWILEQTRHRHRTTGDNWVKSAGELVHSIRPVLISWFWQLCCGDIRCYRGEGCTGTYLAPPVMQPYLTRPGLAIGWLTTFKARLVNSCLFKKNEMIRKIDISTSPEQRRTEKNWCYMLSFGLVFLSTFLKVHKSSAVMNSVTLHEAVPQYVESLRAMSLFWEGWELDSDRSLPYRVICNDLVLFECFHISNCVWFFTSTLK